MYNFADVISYEFKPGCWRREQWIDLRDIRIHIRMKRVKLSWIFGQSNWMHDGVTHWDIENIECLWGPGAVRVCEGIFISSF